MAITQFEFDERLIDVVRAIPGRKWASEGRSGYPEHSVDRRINRAFHVIILFLHSVARERDLTLRQDTIASAAGRSRPRVAGSGMIAM
jgi:hypothetical protein